MSNVYYASMNFLVQTEDFFVTVHSDLLFYNLHLLLDRHPSDAERRAQLRSSLLLQQLAVVLDDAVGLPRQLSLGVKGEVLKTRRAYLQKKQQQHGAQ